MISGDRGQGSGDGGVAGGWENDEVRMTNDEGEVASSVDWEWSFVILSRRGNSIHYYKTPLVCRAKLRRGAGNVGFADALGCGNFGRLAVRQEVGGWGRGRAPLR